MSPFLRYTLFISGSALLSATLTYGWQRSRASEAQHLRSSIEQMKRTAYAQHRAQSSPKEFAPPSTSPAAAQTAQTPPKTKAAHYRFEGQATPVNALHSVAWACDQGDIGAIIKLVHFDEAARPKAEAYLAHLPPEMRAKAPNIEALAALLLVDDGMQRPYPRSDILARATVEEVSPGRVRVRLPGTPRDNGLYQQVDRDWKYVVTEEAVDRYLANAQRR